MGASSANCREASLGQTSHFIALHSPRSGSCQRHSTATIEISIQTRDACHSRESESNINTTIRRTDELIVRVLKRYRKELGGKIQWIAQTYPEPNNLKDNIQRVIDNGAVGAYCMGGVQLCSW